MSITVEWNTITRCLSLVTFIQQHHFRWPNPEGVANDVHSVGSVGCKVQTHSTPLDVRAGPALVGVHQNLPLRVPSERYRPPSYRLRQANPGKASFSSVQRWVHARSTSTDCSSGVPSDCRTSDEPVKVTIIQ